MKNIIKIVIVMLTSISLFTSAYAGELKVTGSAKATYNILSGKNQNAGKGLGVSNEISFVANGEVPLGTWAYKMNLDPADAAAGGAPLNDDTTLTLATSYGTFGFFMLDGDLSVQNAASNSVYARPTDIGDPSGVVNSPAIDSFNNVQYHSPAGLLPFGVQGKVAYAPNADTTNNNANGSGAVVTKGIEFAGENVTQYQLSATPIDGLSVQADYIDFRDGGTGVAATTSQKQEAGSVAVKYAIGAVKVGYSESRYSPALTTTGTGTVEWYDQDNMSIAFAVNQDLSISYEVEKSDRHMKNKATATVEQKSSAVQAAYTMGGMTMAVSHGSYKNNAYIANADADQTIFAVTMAF